MTTFSLVTCHGGAASGTVTAKQENHASNYSVGLSVWSVHVLPAWVLSWYSNFLPQSKNAPIRWLATLNCPYVDGCLATGDSSTVCPAFTLKQLGLAPANRSSECRIRECEDSNWRSSEWVITFTTSSVGMLQMCYLLQQYSLHLYVLYILNESHEVLNFMSFYNIVLWYNTKSRKTKSWFRNLPKLDSWLNMSKIK